MTTDTGFTANPWMRLKDYTKARIALGRCGTSLPTHEHLNFQMNQAMARDAVHKAFDAQKLKSQINRIEGYGFSGMTEILHSKALDRTGYLLRPDLGRRLDERSLFLVQKIGDQLKTVPDLCLVIGDGLSATAVEAHALPFLRAALPLLREKNISTSPVFLVEQSRVATADDIAQILGSTLVAILIGERPGLQTPDSMGLYLSYKPKAGITTDEDRNCISNIHLNGLHPSFAAAKMVYLVEKALKLKLTGVNLKDDQNSEDLIPAATAKPALET